MAKVALSNILVPLAGFALDVGLSTRELQGICRVAAVKAAANRQRNSNLRVSISGISAVTGIPRADVSRILKTKNADGQLTMGNWPHSINRILSIWNESPKFTYQTGRPADLGIYGSGRTFESLVKRYGSGLPVRAILDELIRVGSVELISGQKVRLKSSISMERGFNARELKLFSQRAAELLESVLYKIRKPDSQFILSSIEGNISEGRALPLLRKEFVNSSEDLLTGLRESLFRPAIGSPTKGLRNNHQHIRVTVLYQEAPKSTVERGPLTKRRNFRRQAR